MSEEQVVKAGVQRRSRAEADQLVAEFEASGLGRREFCARRGVALSTLDLYCTRQRRAAASAEPSSGAKLVPVELSGVTRSNREPCGSGLTLVLANGKIEVERDFDETTLKRLLGVLEPR
jgi:hypothetical protein